MVSSINKSNRCPMVSVVILNWNGVEDTLNCLASVNKLDYSNFEIIVVDNGSIDPIDKLEKINGITLVKNIVNLGFAGGQNSALPYCNGEYILLLNNDATIHPNAINEALNTFNIDNKIAVVGGKSYSVDQMGVATHGFYSYQRIDPVTADVQTYNTDPSDSTATETVTVSGSAVMIKRSVIDRVGYFDNRFFAYYEETDLFARYLRAGYKVFYNPNFIIWHQDGASTRDKRYMYYYLMLKNQFLFAYKNFDKRHVKLFRKTYLRNFRRSLWVYLKDGSNAGEIHKARVKSTLWNVLHIISTIYSRNKTQKLNRFFNYSEVLTTSQPVNASLIIDATNTVSKKSSAILDSLLGSPFIPSEIIIVSNKKLEYKNKIPFISIRNIVDKGLFDISYREYGFMSSNTDILMFSKIENINKGNITQFSKDILMVAEKQTSNESVVVINKKTSSAGSDLRLTNGGKSSLFSVRKSALINFLQLDLDLKDLSNDTLGSFINWCVVECMPITRLKLSTYSKTNDITSPVSSYPILTRPLLWNIKKILRAAHLSRLVGKFRKELFKILRKNNSNSSNFIEFDKKVNEYSKSAIKNTPILVNSRDRVDPLRLQLNWLNKSGFKKIAIIDNDSTYSDLLDFFEKTNAQVIPLGRNGMHKSPWESFGVRFIAKNMPYIVTDPDVIPTEITPSTTIFKLYEILQKYPAYNKVGVALKIDDLPDYYSMKQSVIEWEGRFWSNNIKLEKDVYAADIDTTFALYKPNTWWFLSPSIRVAGKYTMRHEPWYQNLDTPTDDMMYYRARASNEVSTWTKGKLPEHHLRALKKEGLL